VYPILIAANIKVYPILIAANIYLIACFHAVLFSHNYLSSERSVTKRTISFLFYAKSSSSKKGVWKRHSYGVQVRKRS
jgi:hypothetical protein